MRGLPQERDRNHKNRRRAHIAADERGLHLLSSIKETIKEGVQIFDGMVLGYAQT